MDTLFTDVDDEYSSLGACVDALSVSRDWLFRGEASARYFHTTSMLQRVREDAQLPPRARAQIEETVNYLAANFPTSLAMSQAEAWGFLQHYEAPTDRLDFTADASIAGYFASGAAKPVPVGTPVLLAALSISKAKAVAELIDLRNHPKAERPRRQKAFTLFIPDQPHIDLKSRSARDCLGIKWFRCTISDDDLCRFGGQESILDAHTDAVAGVIQLWIDDHVKMNDWSAKWLADHVVAAPFVTQVVGQTTDGQIVVELCSAEAAGLEFDEVLERFNNHRVWSNAYPDKRGFGGLSNVRWKNM
jgi:hypothetical protein